MPVTTTSRVVTTRVTNHDLSIHGRAGAMMFILLVTLGMFIIAFATSGWRSYSNQTQGLWEVCRRASSGENWFTAVQAMCCLAMIGLIIAVILIFLYMFASTVSKYQVLLGLVIDTFLTFAFMLIAIIIFGAKVEDNVSWSYAVAVISTILCLAAGIVSTIQISCC